MMIYFTLCSLIMIQVLVANPSELYTKVDLPANIFVGAEFPYQKIKMFHINNSKLACTDRYLPILFFLRDASNSVTEVQGFVTEYGNLIPAQEEIECRIIKKYKFFLTPQNYLFC